MAAASLLFFNTVNSVLLFSHPVLAEDGRLNFTQMSSKYGHNAEEHRVVTEDGYILDLFRLPGEKPPVLLLHGITDSSDSFIIRGNSSLAIILANEGYDVWAGNTRGNRYARQHIKLDPDTDPSFWDYSFHEHGYYDLPAIVDYILNATGYKTLKSIGHSEGTTDHFVLGSLRPEYNEKFDILIAMGPSAIFKHLTPPLSTITEMGPLLDRIGASLKLEELFRDGGIDKYSYDFFCSRAAVVCRQFIFSLGGDDPKRLEPEFLPILFKHFPTSSSRKGLIHYSQLAIRKRFAPYDYGPEENSKRYGLPAPPDYNLTQATMKIALFVGKNDLMNGVKDVEHLRARLPNVVRYHLMEPERWNHFDFVWSNDMPETLFPHILNLLEKY